VLLGSHGQLVLADFGIAVIFDPRTSHQTVEGFVGSLEYAAPEQFLEKPGPTSDQYALATMV
jgi:serine/threonine protein kinase